MKDEHVKAKVRESEEATKPIEYNDWKWDRGQCKGERKTIYLERVFGALGLESEGKEKRGLFELSD